MRRKSVWKQRAIAYLAAVSLAVGMIPASLPAADAYAEETDVEETAVLEADVQQADEQELSSGQEADEQEADVKEAEQEADEQEAEESDDSLIAPEQATTLMTTWADYVVGENPETIIPNTDPEYADSPEGPTETGLHDKIWRYNQSEYIQGYQSVIYDINQGNRPTVLFGTYSTTQGYRYQFNFDYLMRWARTPGTWNLGLFWNPEIDEDNNRLTDRINTFEVYLYSGELKALERSGQSNGELQQGIDEIINNSEKIGTFLGKYQDWSTDKFSFEAQGEYTTIIFKSVLDDYCASLVTKMTLEPTEVLPSNEPDAKSNSNLIKNGICDANQADSGWKVYEGNGEVSYVSNGNGGTAIELNKGECEGVSQYLPELLQKGDTINFAFDITGTSSISEDCDTVEVWLYGDGEPVKLTTAKAKDGEWQTVSGIYHIQENGPQVGKIVLKASSNGDSGAVIDNVSVILSTADREGGSQKDDLSKEKAEAIAIVEDQDTLTPDQKKEYEDKIIDATTEDDILDALKEAAKKAIENKGEGAEKEVEDGDYSPKEELKKEIAGVVGDTVDDIDNASTAQKIGEVLEDGKEKIDDILIKGINDVKKEALDAIDGMENLPDDKKKEHKDKIENEDDPTKIIDELKKAAKEELDNKAKEVRDEIDELPIGNKDKNQAKGDVDSEKNTAKNKVTNSDTVDKIVEEVTKGKDKIDEAADEARKKAGDKTSVDKNKDDAKDSVDDMKDLTPKEKEDAKKEIDKATDNEGVRDALKDAAKKEIDNAADKAKKETDALPNLTQAEKNKVKDDIDKTAADAKENIEKSDTVKEIDDATKKGVKDINDLVVDAAKKSGKDTIDKMDNLSKDEKDKYKKELDKADTEDKVNQVLKDAAKKDLDNYAKDAKDKIDKTDFLTDADKNDLKKKVDQAAEDAKKKIDAAKNPAEIKKAADDGKAKINAIVNWTVNLTKEEINIWKNSQSLASVENSILNTNTDAKDPKGSTFSKLRAKGVGQNKKIKLTWKKQSKADGYIIYGSACGKNNKMKKLTTIKNGKKTTWTHKKCKKGRYYKYIVVAYKTIAGEQRVIARSIGVHATTNGGKYGNPTKAIVKSKKKITLKKGKTTKIKATYKKTKKVAKHISILRYESSNPKVATVDKKGKVKAKKPGNCTIYVYTQNGFWATVKVKVTK